MRALGALRPGRAIRARLADVALVAFDPLWADRALSAVGARGALRASRAYSTAYTDPLGGVARWRYVGAGRPLQRQEEAGSLMILR